MELLLTLGAAFLIGFGALWGAILLPWGSLARRKRTLTTFFCILAATGVIATLWYALGHYRHGTDGGWWPVIVVAYSSAWALALSIVLAISKLFGLFLGSSQSEA